MNEQTPIHAEILAIERPERELLTYYLISSLAWGPAAPVGWVLKYFRYHTLRYRFTAEGVSMSWGILFRREIHLTYARIQDIHLVSNIVERWLGLARIDIQTASGTAKAEMTVEGIKEFEALRDFLYEKMRGARGAGRRGDSGVGGVLAEARSRPGLASLLLEIAEELRGLRRDLERRRTGGEGIDA